MLPIVRSVRMNVYLSGVVVHHPKPPSIWKEGDRLRWRMENSVAHQSTSHACVRLRCGVVPINCALRCSVVLINCALRCTILPISQTRRLSPTTSVVPPLSKKEGFASLHHPLSSFMSKFRRGCSALSLLPCGRRGTACGGGQRTWWLIRVPHTLAPILALLFQLAGFACMCPTLYCLTNQSDPAAITHRWRGPPSFRERGLCFVALSQLCRKPAFFWKAGFGLFVIGWYW